MVVRRALWRVLAAIPLMGIMRRARAQSGDDSISPTGGPGMEMLTIFLRHDQTMTVDQINQHLKKTGWFDHFPPPDVEVVSWYVMMGIGQVVTLRFAAEKIREINRLIEGEAWGGFATEFYPTYDYRELYAQLQSQMRSSP